jgi:hypothetical protein
LTPSKESPGPLHLRAGEWVEVRSAPEILASLDAKGELEGLPFMPEQLLFCGKRLRVQSSAHKTCDTISGQLLGRRMDGCVHLEAVRCDGSAHGGCQAGCLMFWKDAWLKRVEAPRAGLLWPLVSHPRQAVSVQSSGPRSAADLERLAVREGTRNAPDARYSCQITQLLEATRPLAWWEPRQYLEDWLSGNWQLGVMLRTWLLGLLAQAVVVGRAYRLKLRIYKALARSLGEPPWPYARGTVTGRTPSATLGLQPGELVQVKSHDEILATLNDAKNRGMGFSAEMVEYCGGTYRVHSRVEKILDEKTGKMLRMNNDCIILENVVCRSQCSGNRRFCPRSIYPFWREIWLRRIPNDSPAPRRESA